MSAERQTAVENALLVATGVVEPVAEALKQLAGAAILPEEGRANPAGRRDIARALKGWYWAVPVEATGVYNGAACVFVPQELVAARDDAARDDEDAASFASMIDEYLARAGEKLEPAWGGPVSLDRLGLRRVPADSVPQVLSEALGTSDLLAAHFPAKSAEGSDAGDVLVVLGGRLVHELAGRPGRELRRTPAARLPATKSGESSSPKSARDGSTPRSAKDLIARARSLKVRVSADVADRSMTLGELAGLAPGSIIDLGKKVTDPLELRIYGAARRGHLVASGDAVTLPRGFGFRVRYLGVK